MDTKVRIGEEMQFENLWLRRIVVNQDKCETAEYNSFQSRKGKIETQPKIGKMSRNFEFCKEKLENTETLR